MNPIGALVESIKLPNHPEVERAALFLLLSDKNLMLVGKSKLHRRDFFNSANRELYDVLVSLSERDADMSIDTILAEAKLAGKNLVTEESVAAVTIVPEGEPTQSNLASIVAILRADNVKRTAIDGLITGAVMARAENVTSEQLSRQLEDVILKMRNLTTDDREATPMRKLLMDLCDEIEVRMAHPDGIMGVPTGFYKLDEIMGGARAGELIIVSGWTGRGKSTFVLQWAIHAATLKIPAVIYSLEMTDSGTRDRIGAMVSGIDHYKIRRGRMDIDERTKLVGSFGEYYDAPFWHDFVSGMTAEQICARTRIDKLQKNIGIMFVDHVGKLASERGFRGSREQEVAASCGAFDQLADELQIPVVLCSQMNRPFAPDGSMDEPIPTMHKLRESGRLEQDADWVIFTHRPNIKKTAEERITKNDYSIPEKAMLIIDKGRSGESGVSIPVMFDGKHARFTSVTA